MGVFANALSYAVRQRQQSSPAMPQEWPGLSAWLLARFRHRALRQPRLALVERINLAPRQNVALIEADGQRLLVATSADGVPSFYPLQTAPIANRPPRAKKKPAEGKCS